MESIEFIESHAAVGTGGQDWPVEHFNRDQEIADHIELTKLEIDGYE